MKQYKIKLLIFLTLYIIHCTLYIAQAQPVRKDFTFYRGDYAKLTYQVNGNITTYNLLFAVKLTKSFSSPRLVQKTNLVTTEITTTYKAPFTIIEVFLNPEDTRDLTSKLYYYDLIKTDPLDSTKETTIFTGELKNDLDVVSPFDGATPPTGGTRFYVAGTFVDSTTVDSSLFMWDEATQEIVTVPYQQYVGAILPDSILYPKDSLAQRTYSDLKYVDKASVQTITGQKNFEGTVVFNDTNYTFMKLNGLLGYGDWYWHTRNFWVNTANRPDQVMRFGYNVAPGGGVVNSSDGGITVEMESFYDIVGFPSMEFHLAFISKSSRPYRFLTCNYNTAGLDADLGFQFKDIAYRSNYGVVYAQGDSSIMSYHYPFQYSFEANNTPTINQLNAGHNALLLYPYFDNNDRFYLGDATTFYAPNGYLSFYNNHTRLNNRYFCQSYNSDNDIVNMIGYYDDKLQIKADTSEDIYIYSRNLFHTDWDGNIVNLVNPSYPLDTNGVSIGKKYIDIRTGDIKQILGTNLVVNGDFTDWTGTGKTANPVNWVVSWEDTTKNYVNQSPTGEMHFVYAYPTHQDSSLTLYQLGATVGHLYGYSFDITITGKAAIEIAGNRIDDTFGNITSGIKSGITDSATINKLFVLRRYSQTDYCDVVIDNIRIWDMNGSKSVPTYDVPNVLDSLGTLIAGVGSTSIGNPDSLGGQPANAYFDTLSVSIGAMDTVLTGDYPGWKVPNNITITEVSAYTNSGTVTFNLEERGETTPNTVGTDVMTSDLVADSDQQETSTFSNSTLDRNDWLILNVTSITGDPTIFSASIRYVKTN